MKAKILDATHRTADETASHANQVLIGATWLATRISAYRKKRANERTLQLLKRSLGEIPTHLLEDTCIDEYEVAEILAKRTRESRILIYPFFQTKR